MTQGVVPLDYCQREKENLSFKCGYLRNAMEWQQVIGLIYLGIDRKSTPDSVKYEELCIRFSTVRGFKPSCSNKAVDLVV